MVKKRHGSIKNSAVSEATAIKEEDECKPNFSDTKLLILIDCISGLDSSKVKSKQDLKYPVEVIFRVSLGEEVLGSSQVYPVPDTERHQIQYQVLHNFTEDPSQTFLSLPLTIAVLAAGGGKEKASKRGSSRGTRTSTNKSGSKPATSGTDNVLMEATVDLLPLVFGEREIEERVGDLVEVLIRVEGSKLKIPMNLVYVTVQNLYNPPGQLLASDAVSTYLVLHTVPSVQQQEKTSEEVEKTSEEDWSMMRWGSGLVTSLESGVEPPTRRWFSVQNGPPAYSQYRNLPDEERTRDTGRLTALESNRSNVFLTWNQLTRLIVDKSQQEKLLTNLIQNGEWLLEIFIKKMEERKRGRTAGGTDAGKSPKKSEQEPILEPEPEVPTYVVKLDLSELLHPGVNCCRVVGQLMSLKSNEEKSDSLTPISSHTVMSKISSKPPNKDEEENKVRTDDNKVVDFEGRPSYISVLVELYTSFRPRKTIQQLLFSVTNFVNQRVDECLVPTDDVSSPFQAHARYKTTVLDNIHYLHTIYQELKAKEEVTEGSEQEQEVEDKEDLDTKFKNELDKSGALDLIKRSINEAVTSLLRDTQCGKPEGLCEAYCKLLEETQGALEEARKTERTGSTIRATSDELLEAAREASEEGNYQLAQEYLLKRMHYYGKRDADMWRDVAVLSLRHGDSSRAKQALLTTLCLQPRHKDGLLMLAVLLTTEGKHQDASTIFEALTTFYPRFYRGWFSYFCFFESIENKQGSDVCLSFGSVCLRDKARDEGELRPCYWCPDMTLSETDGFLLTAVYLLALNLWQLGENCLSQHRLEMGEDTVPYLYYLAVSHHLQGKYKQSNSHLKQALSMSWNDEKLWNLMGHNLYRMNNWDRAVDCYQLILDQPQPVSNYSLTFYRMGKIMLQKGEHEDAARYYLRSVNLSPSLQSWTGLAKASYWMGDLNDAELAAREANRLDDQASEPWACLALINYRNCTNPQLATHCLSLAQCGQIDEELLKEIHKIINSYD